MAGLEIKAELVACFILRRTKQGIDLLLLKRDSQDSYTPDVFQILYGHISDSESAPETVVRELWEETGLAIEELYSLNESFVFYDRNSGCMQVTPVFVALVDATTPVVLNTGEHSEANWIAIQKAPELLIWHAQRKALSVLEEHLKNGQIPKLMQIQIKKSQGK